MCWAFCSQNRSILGLACLLPGRRRTLPPFFKALLSENSNVSRHILLSVRQKMFVTIFYDLLSLVDVARCTIRSYRLVAFSPLHSPGEVTTRF